MPDKETPPAEPGDVYFYGSFVLGAWPVIADKPLTGFTELSLKLAGLGTPAAWPTVCRSAGATFSITSVCVGLIPLGSIDMIQ